MEALPFALPHAKKGEITELNSSCEQLPQGMKFSSK
jgi:hypothetical protein